MKKKENQQGTLLANKKDTSETICLDTFNNNNKNFLNWFIGYLEGSEQFLIINEQNLRFELNVHICDKFILSYIKKKLGFGKIKLEIFLDTKIYVYNISVEDDLITITNLLNGKWRSKDKLINFQLWWKKLERRLKKSKKNKLLKPLNIELCNISLKDSWLSGYLENRAIFISKLRKLTNLENVKKLNIYIFIWSIHTEILLDIKNLLNVNNPISFKYKGLNVYKIMIEEIFNLKILINYLKIFKLKTSKNLNYKNWLILFNYNLNKKTNLNMKFIKKFYKKV